MGKRDQMHVMYVSQIFGLEFCPLHHHYHYHHELMGKKGEDN